MRTLNIVVFVEKLDSRFAGRLDGYQHLWKFQRLETPFADILNKSVLWDDDGAWMVIPGWERHTSHFSENIMIVNHRAANPRALPPVVIGVCRSA